MKLAALAAIAAFAVACGGTAPAPPAAAPTVNTDAANWQAFRDHIVNATDEVGDILDAVERAASASDVPALSRAVDRMLDWTRDEQAWLRANPPADCYRPVHAGWRAAVSRYDEAFSTIKSGLERTDAGAFERGTAMMQEGTALISETRPLISQTSC